MQGSIKVLKNGFGFIASEETEGDVFFHASQLEDIEFNALQEGNEVSFEIGDGNNGKKQALNVRLV